MNQVNTIVDSTGSRYCKGCGNAIEAEQTHCKICGIVLIMPKLYKRVTIHPYTERSRVRDEGRY